MFDDLSSGYCIGCITIVKTNLGFRVNDEIGKALLLWQAGCGVTMSHSTDNILHVNFATSIFNVVHSAVHISSSFHS